MTFLVTVQDRENRGSYIKMAAVEGTIKITNMKTLFCLILIYLKPPCSPRRAVLRPPSDPRSSGWETLPYS